MLVLSNARRVSRILKASIVFSSHHFLASHARIVDGPQSSRPWGQESFSIFSFQSFSTLGMAPGCGFGGISQSMHLMKRKALFSTAENVAEGSPTEIVKELHDKMLQAVNVQRSMPPNAWLWSLIENCKSLDDIKLLFDILQNLRRFRLSNLRIHDNFNCNLCREVAKACARVGALEFGKKALWKHNVYGLTPSIASAHHLLLYAKDHNDTKLVVEIMKLLKANNLPLQAGTADIVFSICYNADDWELISKYSKRFIKAGVKLRATSFNTWMEFAAKRGDTESLWTIEKLRSQSMKRHTIASGFSCAKGLLLEHKPQDAAAVIQLVYQSLSDAKKSSVFTELQKVVNDWPAEVIKHRQAEDRKELANALSSDIPIMINSLLNMGLEVNINLEALSKTEGLLSKTSGLLSCKV